VDDIVPILRAAGVAKARGFSLNVSNFAWTRDEIAYGRAISRRLGGKHFVLDTSRNGRGPLPQSQWKKDEDGWCNPWDRALGRPPSVQPGVPLVDAFLWVKHPGESDGTCNGGPPSGEWWPDYALGLARRARW
jgi:endoglucanase